MRFVNGLANYIKYVPNTSLVKDLGEGSGELQKAVEAMSMIQEEFSLRVLNETSTCFLLYFFFFCALHVAFF